MRYVMTKMKRENDKLLHANDSVHAEYFSSNPYSYPSYFISIGCNNSKISNPQA